jgi:AcrR family transcriptional regulator
MAGNVGSDSIVVNENIRCQIWKNMVNSSPVKPSTRPYHHGHLRQELLRAAETALEAGGVQHLSLRELSRELGVSHASPQRHFATKQDLLDALAIMGFERLSSVVAKAAETRSQDLNARLTKAASAYVGFALKHPALFALMFEAKRRPGMLPELRTALMAAFSHIPKILQEGQEAGKIVAGDPDRLALTLGAALHGLVAMSIDGKIKGAPLKAIVSDTVQHLLKGLSTNKI